jgi:hypothetical protein
MANGIIRLAEAEDLDRTVRLHPAWCAFIRYCQDLRFGEVDRLKIQDGLPMIAEEVKRKVKFDDERGGRS